MSHPAYLLLPFLLSRALRSHACSVFVSPFVPAPLLINSLQLPPVYPLVNIAYKGLSVLSSLALLLMLLPAVSLFRPVPKC